MPATSGTPERASGPAPALPPVVPGACWRREFPGHGRQLSVLRRWLAGLLPPGPARDDVVMIADELASNAIIHTLSGQGGTFTVEVTWYGPAVRVAVTDEGAPTGPRESGDPASEHGRGLAVVRELSLRRGVCGDHRGRLAWADVRWDGTAAAVAAASPAGLEAAVRDAGAALARRFTGVPAWFGRATRAWWALAGSAGLVTAPTAPELASLLDRLPGTRPPAPGSGAADPGGGAADPGQDRALRQPSRRDRPDGSSRHEPPAPGAALTLARVSGTPAAPAACAAARTRPLAGQRPALAGTSRAHPAGRHHRGPGTSRAPIPTAVTC
jgi:Histidine kinase-like ATPase domain